MLSSALSPVARYDYDPYGRSVQTGGTETLSAGYTGHFRHPSGLLLTHHRSYDSGLGRWLSADPLGFVDGPNLYAYVNGNPLTRIDPLGLRSDWVMRICCDGKGGFKVCRNPNNQSFDREVMACMEEHEETHIRDMTSKPSCRDLCTDKKRDVPVLVPKDDSNTLECSAYKAERDCLNRKGPWPRIRERMPFVEQQIKQACKVFG